MEDKGLRKWLLSRCDWEFKDSNDPNDNRIPLTEVEKLMKLRLMKIEKKVTFFGWFIIYTLLVGFNAPSWLMHILGVVAAWNFIDFALCAEVVKEYEKEFK